MFKLAVERVQKGRRVRVVDPAEPAQLAAPVVMRAELSAKEELAKALASPLQGPRWGKCAQTKPTTTPSRDPRWAREQPRWACQQSMPTTPSLMNGSGGV